MGALEQTSDSTSHVRIDASHRDGLLSVEVIGLLDISSVHRLRRTVESLAAGGDVVRIDLRGADSIGTTELGSLLRMHQRGVARGWNLTWIGLPRHLLDVSRRFGIPGAIVALVGVSLGTASRPEGWGASEQEAPDAT